MVFPYFAICSRVMSKYVWPGDQLSANEKFVIPTDSFGLSVTLSGFTTTQSITQHHPAMTGTKFKLSLPFNTGGAMDGSQRPRVSRTEWLNRIECQSDGTASSNIHSFDYGIELADNCLDGFGWS
jgi:hypothetical protein